MIKASNVIRGESDVQVIGTGTLAMLKMIAEESPQKRSRMLLHDSHESVVQEMVICLHKSGYFRPHKHPTGKTESYHMIEGEMDVRIFSEEGKLIQPIRLGKDAPLYRLRGGIYHQPLAISEWVIYHEVYTGPYNKDKDVEYATWAPEEK